MNCKLLVLFFCVLQKKFIYNMLCFQNLQFETLAPPIPYMECCYHLLPLPFAAQFISSPTTLITRLGKLAMRKSAETIDTWAPVSHKTSTVFPLCFALTVHLRPTRLINLSCSLGVRWLIKPSERLSCTVSFLL